MTSSEETPLLGEKTAQEVTVAETKISQVDFNQRLESFGEQPLGAGTFGEVLLCKLSVPGSDSSISYAYKQLLEFEEDVSMEENEVVPYAEEPWMEEHDALCYLGKRSQRKGSEYVIKLCSDMIQHAGIHAYLLEYVDGCDLFELLYSEASPIEEIPLMLAFSITHQLLQALDFCHKLDLAHRDVKPGNIMASDKSGEWRIKLIDFDSSRMMGGQEDPCEDDIFGRTYGYYELTLIESREIEPEKTLAATDVFAAFLILYELLLCNPYYDFEQGEEQKRRLRYASGEGAREHHLQKMNKLMEEVQVGFISVSLFNGMLGRPFNERHRAGCSPARYAEEAIKRLEKTRKRSDSLIQRKQNMR